MDVLVVVLVAGIGFGCGILYAVHVYQKKLAGQIRRIVQSPKTRIQKDSPLARIVADLITAINELGRNYDNLSLTMASYQSNLQEQNSDQTSILQSFISELPEGVILCNTQGAILLHNRRAEEFFPDLTAVKANSANTNGTSVFKVFDKNQISRALDQIREKIHHQDDDLRSNFIVKGNNNRILRAHTIPIIRAKGHFSGFVLIFRDLTHQIKADNRVHQLLQSLSRSARSPLSSIRSAIEAILEYPHMPPERLFQFHQIILKESISLSQTLNQVSDECASLMRSPWNLTPITGRYLLESIRLRAAEQLNIRISVQEPVPSCQLKVDMYSLVFTVIYMLFQIRYVTDVSEYQIQINLAESFIHMDIIWGGPPVPVQMVRQWEDQTLEVAGQSIPLTLRDVLNHHKAEIWSFAPRKAHDACIVRMILPASPVQASAKWMVLPETRGDVMDRDMDAMADPFSESDHRLLIELAYTMLIRETRQARDVEAIRNSYHQLPHLISNMLASGTKMQVVNRLITRFADTVLSRLIQFAVDEMGPPPVRFAFLVLGSEGRQEQTLKTDQDNAIVFETPTDHSLTPIQQYFLQMGKLVCSWLHHIGYTYCQGDIMASNPKWCQPLDTWKSYFHHWIHAASPEDLLHSSIFFDFRLGHGDLNLVDQLREYLSRCLGRWTGFLRYMAENTLQFKPPLGMFGTFQVAHRGTHKHQLDLKAAMTPVVDFARIMALKHDIHETNTQWRLYQLHQYQQLSLEEYTSIDQAYSVLMQLRFLSQIQAIISGNAPADNYIDPKKLSSFERKMLREAFRCIEKIQSKLSFDFTGTSATHFK